MEEIKSYIIMDIETTGLPGNELGFTKITELSMVGVLKKHLNDDKESTPPKLPRVLNKLTLCFHPEAFITDESTRITKLNNEILEEQTAFNVKTYELIEQFILRMPRPICLIAHNGMKFDFPILQAHIKKLGKNFPGDLLCADSLLAFRDLKIVEPDVGTSPQINEPEEESKRSLHSSSSPNNNIPQENGLKVRSTELENIDTFDFILNLNVSPILTTTDLYGSTPKRFKSNDFSNGNCNTEMIQTPKKTQASTCRQNSNKTIGRSARRKLFPMPYKLSNIYWYLTKTNITNVHSAEGDALALTECIFVIGNSFHKWVQSNHKKFSSIRKTW